MHPRGTSQVAATPVTSQGIVLRSPDTRLHRSKPHYFSQENSDESHSKSSISYLSRSIGAMSPLVACVGLTTIDLIQWVDALPAANQKVVSTDLLLDVGGPAANAARVAAASGCRVRLVTALGDSDLATLARERLRSIELIDIAPASHELPVSMIMVTPDGSRSVVSRNAGALVEPELPTPEVVSDADVVLHDGHLLAASVSLAAQPGPIHLLDGGSFKPGLDSLLPLLDAAVISADFALPERTPNQALADMGALGVGLLARSRGSDSVEVLIEGERSELPVPRVAVVDTTGAGDVLHGALAAQLAHGLGFTDALEKAISVASQSVTHRGVLPILGLID